MQKDFIYLIGLLCSICLQVMDFFNVLYLNYQLSRGWTIVFYLLWCFSETFKISNALKFVIYIYCGDPLSIDIANFHNLPIYLLLYYFMMTSAPLDIKEKWNVRQKIKKKKIGMAIFVTFLGFTEEIWTFFIIYSSRLIYNQNIIIIHITILLNYFLNHQA